MDVFKGIGNFFRGAFKGDDEEKKRKQREEAQRKAQQQQAQLAQRQAQKPTTISSPSQLFGKKGGSLDIASPAQLQMNKPSEYDPRRDSPTNPAVIAEEVGKASKKVLVDTPVNLVKGVIKEGGESVAEAIWTRKQANEANRAIKERTDDKGLFASPAYQKSRRDAIDEAERSKAINSNRAKQLREELEANISKASKEVKGVQQESKEKYGRDVADSGELLADTAIAASNLAIGGGTAIKVVGKEAVEALLPTAIRNAEKLTGRALSRVEFEAVVKKVKGVADDIAKDMAIKANEKKIAEEATKEVAQEATKVVAEPGTVERQLQDIINDKDLPAFERKRAQDALNKKMADDVAPDVGDISEVPSFQRQGKELPSTQADRVRADELRKIADNMPNEEAVNSYRFNIQQRYADAVRKRPDLEAQLRKRYEQELAQLETNIQRGNLLRAELDELDNKINLSQQQTKTAVRLQEELARQQSDEAAKVVQEVQDARTASVTPSEGDRVKAPVSSSEVAANNAYVDELGNELETVDGDVILYHRTGKEAAENIRKEGRLDPNRAGTGNDKAISEDGKVSYLNTNPSQYFYGDEVIKVRMPIEEYKVALRENVDTIAKLQREISEGKIPEMYVDGILRQIENIKKNPEILSPKALSVYTDPVPVTPASARAGAPGDPTLPPKGDPGIDANNAFTTDNLYDNAPTFAERGDLSFREKYNPERLFRENVSRPLLETLPNKAIAAAQTSDNAVARGLGRFFTGFSREAGLTEAELAARRHLRGSIDMGKLNRETIGDLSKNMTPEAKEKVWATLDPEMAGRKGIDVAELTPEELVLQGKLKGIIDDTTNEMLRRGLITPEAAANGSYIKRAYNVFDAGNDEAFKKFEGGFRTELLNQTKGRKVVSDEMVEQAITDPTYLVGKKTAEAQALFAMQDYGNFLVKSGTAVDGARPGFTQLPDSPVFGDAAGKWVPHNFSEDFTGFQYQNAFVSALNDVFTVYDHWNVRQAKKALLTVFNPAVRVGNQASNRMIFSTLGGINPASFNVKMAQVPKMIEQNHQLYREAVSEGLIGLDVTQADFFAKQMANVTDDAGLAKKFMAHMQKSYSGADDQAKIAAYSIYRERGYPVEEAAKMTQRQFQDYKSVGFFYDLASKTPIIGNAFVRFAGDAARIAKNTLIDRPLTAAGAVMTWGALTNLMSIASGESEFKEEQSAIQNTVDLYTGATKSEDQKTREDRFGAPKVLFTNISLTVQTPFGEINAARFMPWHMLNDVSNGVTGMLPFSESPVRVEDGQVEVNPGAMDDPLLGQVVQLAIDKDFRGKSIADPKNSENRDKYAFDPATEGDKLGNRARFLAANNLPMGNELDSITSALTGNEDRYGKTRSVPQAIARMFGIKIEEYGDKQVADQRSRQMYFDDMDKINEELKDMNPTEQEAWRRLTGYYKLREQVENNFEPGTTRDKKAPVYDFGEDKWKDYAANPRLYDLMVQKKQQDAARDGSPIQPEFDERLSASFRKQLIQNKMVAPGDDAELDQRMYSTPEWDYYMSLKDEYKAKSKEYYGDDEYTGDELVKHQDEKFPTKPDLLKAYSAAYGDYLNGKRDKPQFTDEMKLLKHDYNVATFNWTNNARLARGLPAITWDVWNNPTFGFDESKSGGFGFGGGGGGRGRDANLLGNLSNFSGTIKGLDEEAPVEEMPNTVALFQKLMANRSGGRAKPRLGAGSRGQ